MVHKSCILLKGVLVTCAYDQWKTTKKKYVGLIIIPHNKHNITISREMHRQVYIIVECVEDFKTDSILVVCEPFSN